MQILALAGEELLHQCHAESLCHAALDLTLNECGIDGSSHIVGRRHFEDCLGACMFTTRTLLETMCRALNAATGWNFTKEEAKRMGRRTAALFRAFDLRCGLGPELERPSQRYGSTPVDGPAKGHV